MRGVQTVTTSVVTMNIPYQMVLVFLMAEQLEGHQIGQYLLS